MTEDKLTNKIKIVNYILIGLTILGLVYILRGVGASEDEGASLGAIPFVFFGCGFISFLTFELVDLKINRGFYQVKAYIGSILLFVLILVLFITSRVVDLFSMAVLGLLLCHGLLARIDLKSNHPKVDVKKSVLSTIGLILTMPVLLFLIAIIANIFR